MLCQSSLLQVPAANPYGHEVPRAKVGAGTILTDIIFVPQPSLPDATQRRKMERQDPVGIFSHLEKKNKLPFSSFLSQLKVLEETKIPASLSLRLSLGNGRRQVCGAEPSLSP